MNRTRPLLQGVALVLAASTAAIACASTSASASGGQPKPPVAPITAPVTPIAPVAPVASGGGGGKAPVALLPRTWPTTVPVPAGTILGSTSHAPTWSVLILVRAGAATVQKSTIAFYVKRGFVADTQSIVHNAKYRITVLAENRDHSATKTNLTIAVATI